MASNSNLHMSRAGKTDEFYTQLSTIEDELRHYRKYFKGKVIFCNADDPAIGEDGQDHFGDGLGGYTSNFFRYFQLNFTQLGIKKLITTHYEADKPSYKFEIVSSDHDEQIGLPDYVRTPPGGQRRLPFPGVFGLAGRMRYCSDKSTLLPDERVSPLAHKQRTFLVSCPRLL